MTDAPYKDFLCEYRFRGAIWSFVIKATSHHEALERVQAMRSLGATVEGELIARIEMTPPAAPAAGLFLRALCWLRNSFTLPLVLIASLLLGGCATIAVGGVTLLEYGALGVAQGVGQFTGKRLAARETARYQRWKHCRKVARSQRSTCYAPARK